ncbi:MAG: hypothetical protein HXK12_04645 [Actinomyces sp.]|nr:hypothetical protein [Actinomyces sp.]
MSVACGERSPCASKERVTQLSRAEYALAVALAASRAAVLADVPFGQSSGEEIDDVIVAHQLAVCQCRYPSC